MEQRPVSAETWPVWRDFYVRLYYSYETDEPEEFYNRIYAFVADQAGQNQGQLTGALAEDPIAWIILSRYYVKYQSDIARAEETGRRAVALGDAAAMSSFNLVSVLLRSAHKRPPMELTQEDKAKLDEVELRLKLIEGAAPQARLSWYYGLLAGNRRDSENAARFLKQATIELPNKPIVVVSYLSAWASTDNLQKPCTATTEPFVKQFPGNPHILAFHAMALHADERHLEAYDALQQVRALDESVLQQIVGKELSAAIDEGRWMTPDVVAGLELLHRKEYGESAFKFEKALKDSPDNLLAARLLARSHLGAARSSADALYAASECKSLCEKFPKDPELHAARAVALSYGGRPVTAQEELQQAQELGGDVEKLVGAGNVRKIREDARHAEAVRKIWWIAVIVLAGVATWIAVMFVMGALLASAVARQADPDPLAISEEGLCSREAWVQRAYLMVLTVSLVIFYLSLPMVSSGLFAVTIGLFVMMLALRVVDIGILYRGFFAVTGVIRSATVGPSREILGIEVSNGQHAGLFGVLSEVADRLQTQTVDSVYLTPMAQLSVHDRGHGPFGLFRTRRVIEIGVPLFSCLSVSELKSMLAHEYAHFSHRHTFYSRFIFQVSAPLSHSLAVMNAAGGVFNYVNPFYGFYWLYLKAFDLLAAGFSRSHEFLADRRAALAYGKEAFKSSFARVNLEGNLFHGTVVTVIKSGLGAGQTYVNVYEVFRQYRDRPDNHEIRQRLVEDLTTRSTGWYDSHPAFSERLRAVSSIPDSPTPTDSTSSTTLLDDISGIEIQMTDLLTRHIRKVCDIIELPDHLRR